MNKDIVHSDSMHHYFGDYYHEPGLRSGYPVWRKAGGVSQYLFHDSSFRGWIVTNSVSTPHAYLESMMLSECPTQVNYQKDNWWKFANVGWKNDYGHNLHVECNPGLVNATMKPAPAIDVVENENDIEFSN